MSKCCDFNDRVKDSGKIIKAIDEHLRELYAENDKNILKDPRVWENNFIKNQIDRRENPDAKRFTIEDHIRGMVYAMLSSQRKWTTFESQMNLEDGEKKGRLKEIDNIFDNYNVKILKETSPDDLVKKIKENKWGNRRITNQMRALLKDNIKKLEEIRGNNGSVDDHYDSIIKQDPSFDKLIKKLSSSNGEWKMKELGPALTAEYLRNVGYDIAKPDTHVMRILGSERLGFLDEKGIIEDEEEAINIIHFMAEQSGRQSAEVDFMLWSYCADGYGEICTKTPKCDICRLRKYCNYPRH